MVNAGANVTKRNTSSAAMSWRKTSFESHELSSITLLSVIDHLDLSCALESGGDSTILSSMELKKRRLFPREPSSRMYNSTVKLYIGAHGGTQLKYSCQLDMAIQRMTLISREISAPPRFIKVIQLPRLSNTNRDVGGSINGLNGIQFRWFRGFETRLRLTLASEWVATFFCWYVSPRNVILNACKQSGRGANSHACGIEDDVCAASGSFGRMRVRGRQLPRRSERMWKDQGQNFHFTEH